MSLRHALLGVLTTEPMSGYDLVKFFDSAVAFLWHAPHSQIYPELRRMEEAFLVEAGVVPRGKWAQKRVYRITDSGRREFVRWTNDILPFPSRRNPHRLKACYMEWADPDAARRQLDTHIRYYESLLRRWRAVLADIDARQIPLLARRLELTPETDHEAIVAFKRLAFEGEVAHAEAEITWAKDGLALVDRLQIGAAKRAGDLTSVDGEAPLATETTAI